MSIEVTSGAIVYQYQNGERKYLLLQSQNPGHFWGFPKGHVEGDESLMEAAHREILEETQLDVTVNPKYQVQTKYPLPNGNQKVMTLFTAQVSENVQIDLQAVEIKDAQWLNYKEAAKRLTYDNLRVLLSQIDDDLNSNDEK